MEAAKPVRIKNPFTDIVPFLDAVFEEEDIPEGTDPAQPAVKHALRHDQRQDQAANSSATKE